MMLIRVLAIAIKMKSIFLKLPTKATMRARTRLTKLKRVKVFLMMIFKIG